VTWQLASFALLFAALAAGFAWYERSHPSSKVLALVATLAALAALGRVAFAPLPNVKPTTDIALLSGYVLGGAPGFAVGAISAVASNVVFGQGPWTPWQMAGWGLAGLIGAGVARATGRRLGRAGLAVACGLAGALFGGLLDLSTWVAYGGEHTLGQYAAISAASLWFNVAHVVGNVAFALAFGPLFVRSLQRFRERFTVRWEPAVVSALAVAAIGGALAAAPAAHASSIGRAQAYLRSAQNRDGGYGAARGARSSPLFTAWAAIGFAASGRRPAFAGRYLARTAPRMRSVGDVERTILGLVAAGVSPRRAGGVDLVHRLGRAQRRDGSWAGQVNLTSFGILALRAAGAARGQRARGARWVRAQQNRDGGFSFARRGGSSGIDDTAAAVEGLAAAGGRRSGAVRRATVFLARRQNLDGGFPLSPGGASNAQSTAWAVQALVAAGRDPGRVRRRGSRSPLAYLASLVSADGSVRYSRTSRQTPVWVTAQALAALARRPLPVRAP
jgi:hypothetical protein